MKILVLMITCMAIGCGQGQGDTVTKSGDPRAHRLAVEDTFRIFSSPSEHMPLAMRSHLAHLLSKKSTSSFRPTFAERVQTAHGVAWTFVSKDAICVAQGGFGAVACSKAEQASSEGVSLGVFSPPSNGSRPRDFLLFGLAPNGVEQVAITIGKHRRIIDVRNNLFSASGDEPVLIRQFIPGVQ